MFLKRHQIRKDGKLHVYYSLGESVRVGRDRVVQQRLLNLGELNATQVERWQRSIEVIEESGEARQMRLFTDRDGCAPPEVNRYHGEVLLSSLELRRPRSFGAPGSELSVHERWFGKTAMDVLLGCDERVAGKDRLYRALDKAVEHKEALLSHLQGRWEDLFAADCQILLYDLTSTYFEGEAGEVTKARRGYSRDHRPDCVQVVVALVVSSEGFPLCYEIFEGNRTDVTTLEEVLERIETKHGYKGRVWVFDRGIVSEDNLENLRRRGAAYLVGTPKRRLQEFEKELLHGAWQEVSGREGVKVQLIEQGGETYVLARSAARASKESAMRRRQLVAFHRALRALAKSVSSGRVKDADKVHLRLGRLQERYASVQPYLEECRLQRPGKLRLTWRWNKERLRHLRMRDGAYLLRTNLDPMEPECLWAQYIQLTEVESAFRCLKSELSHPPHLAPHGPAGRSPHHGGLPRLLPVGVSQASTKGGGRIAHPGARPRLLSNHPNGGGLVPSSGWPPALPPAHHPARESAGADPGSAWLEPPQTPPATHLPIRARVAGCVDNRSPPHSNLPLKIRHLRIFRCANCESQVNVARMVESRQIQPGMPKVGPKPDADQLFESAEAR